MVCCIAQHISISKTVYAELIIVMESEMNRLSHSKCYA